MNGTNLVERLPHSGCDFSAPRMGTRIVLIRPGATVLDLQGRIKGDLDIPLCPEGQREANLAARQLASAPLQAIYSSPSSSAIQTAAAIAQFFTLRVRVEPDLKNLNHGLWQGKTIEELRKTQPKTYRAWADHPESIAPPGGETIESALIRVGRAIQRIKNRFNGAVVAIVVSEPMTSLLKSHYSTDRLEDFWLAERRTGGWEVIDIL